MESELYLTDQQYLEVLQHFREFIARGGELSYFDCEEAGSKDTQCTWGLCSRLKEHWPGLETHMWPGDGRDKGSPYIYGLKYRRVKQKCPMDKREKPDLNGCFYRCRIFQGSQPTREEAIELYDLSIERLTS